MGHLLSSPLIVSWEDGFRMRSLPGLAVLSALVALVTPSSAEAQPECVTGTLASYLALGSGGCTVGGLAFANFIGFTAGGTHPNYEAFVEGGTLSTAGLTLTPFVFGGGLSRVVGFEVNYGRALTVNVNKPAGQFIPPGTGLPPAVSRSVAVRFDALARNEREALGGLQLLGTTDMSGFTNPVGPSVVVLIGTVGAGASFFSTFPETSSFAAVSRNLRLVQNGSCPTAPDCSGGQAVSMGERPTPGARVTISGSLSISENRTSAATASASLGAQRVGIVVTTPVPEPSTYVFLGTGLLSLGGIAVRRRKRADV